MLILTKKREFLNTYAREMYRSNRYDYPISSLNIFIPEKIATTKIKDFILDSFRESDIVYCNNKGQYLQVLLPFTPENHLDIIIDRIDKKYEKIKKVKITQKIICTKVELAEDIDEAMNSLIHALEKADKKADATNTMEIRLERIFSKLTSIIKEKKLHPTFMNYYCGIKVNYRAVFIKAENDLYTFKTDKMQLSAINKSSSTIIEISKYGYSLSAELDYINLETNTIRLKNLRVLAYSYIYPSSLTVELKKPLHAQLTSMGSHAKISISSISFNEVHGFGDISELVIGNNTIHLLFQKENRKYTLLVEFLHSKFDGKTQRFILKIIDDSQKGVDFFQDLVTKRSRECIQELKQLIAD